jgi:FkbM family methyltransferase
MKMETSGERMLISKVKQLLLIVPGFLNLAWWFVAQDGKRYGVRVRNRGKFVELRNQNHVIRVQPRRVRYAPEICREFELYRHVLPKAHQDDIEVTDFSVNPEAADWEHACLKLGVSIESRDGTVWLRKGVRVMILAPQHLVYSVSMAANFELYFDPLTPREQDGLLILDYSRPGTVQRYANSGLEFELASFPEEEEALEEYFRWYKPKSGDLVFDVGAHCGVSTYLLSKSVGPEGKVISFEPDPLNFAILRRNIERHGLKNVVAVNIAIAGRTGQLPFNCEGTIGSSLTSLMLRESVGSTVTVEAVTLNDAVEKWGPPAFCKIDIEGAEIEALAAAKDALSRNSIYLAINTNHPKVDGRMTNMEIEAILQGYGYDVLSEAKPFMTTWARPKMA